MAGRGNKADFLSRYPSNKISEHWQPPEEYLDAIVDYSIQTHVSKDEILQATFKDPAFVKLSKMIFNFKFNCADQDTEVFSKIFERLSLSEYGLIINDGYQIVIPFQLQDRIFRIAHEGHLGVAKTTEIVTEIKGMVYKS